uniref:Uncharacterized protein n=1 Tax=Romanomermis culicivorax TaxID=13658 RepID=A0A915IVC0_ROMCU
YPNPKKFPALRAEQIHSSEIKKNPIKPIKNQEKPKFEILKMGHAAYTCLSLNNPSFTTQGKPEKCIKECLWTFNAGK